VRRSVSRWTRLRAGTLAALVGVTLAAPSFAGAGAQPVAPLAGRSIYAATNARLATLDTRAAVRWTQAGGPAIPGEAKRSFMKSPQGILAVTLMVGGVVWAIASRSKDAVHSPARQ
jgi:hypothetical protein